VVVPDGERLGTGAGVTALLPSASLLAIASAALFPFQMRTVVSLSGDRLDATHYGFDGSRNPDRHSCDPVADECSTPLERR
jgi:hypothetical protein